MAQISPSARACATAALSQRCIPTSQWNWPGRRRPVFGTDSGNYGFHGDRNWSYHAFVLARLRCSLTLLRANRIYSCALWLLVAACLYRMSALIQADRKRRLPNNSALAAGLFFPGIQRLDGADQCQRVAPIAPVTSAGKTCVQWSYGDIDYLASSASAFSR